MLPPTQSLLSRCWSGVLALLLPLLMMPLLLLLLLLLLLPSRQQGLQGAAAE
jgi:hypothetical protein